jgi:ferric-dicitrate binding protein FerR (iron transport regulator)
MHDKEKEHLIFKYLSGESTPAEEASLRAWKEASEENNKLFLFYKALWQETETTLPDAQPAQAYADIARQVGANSKRPIHPARQRQIWSAMPVLARAAVILLLAVAAISIGYILRQQEQRMAEPQARIIHKSTLKGQKMKTFLPDGSIAWLNAESSISYSEYFGDSLRSVSLQGEVFFEVEKDAQRPFVVQAGSVEVLAVGTAFSVRNYAGEPSIAVSLTEGLVQVDVGHSTDKLMLQPGQGLRYGTADHSLQTIQFDPDRAINWKDGVLHFQNATFDQAIQELRRWYGVDIELQNRPEEEWDYTATFKNFYLREVLQSMAFSKDFEFEIHPNRVIINFKP